MSSQLIRGGTVVTAGGLVEADIRIEGQTIQALGLDLPGADSIVNATGLHILPAVIDVHLHFNEPGRTEWEGAETGSRALAAGGGAVFFDMPLNSTPCTVNAHEFRIKRSALEASSIADFGLWGGLIPGNLPEMAEMASEGAVGFKAFMCNSGLPEFPRADDLTLYEGMAEAARLNLPIAVHAESEELTRKSRPMIAELEAIHRATLFAGETKAKLHIVHISSGRGVVLAAEARARGVDVTIETCPHYLHFTEQDLERLGALAKCAPPLRNRQHQNELWAQLENGTVDIVASDHSPAPPEMKLCAFDKAWGGIAGVQSTLSVLLNRESLPLEHVASLLASHPAKRFRIARKGAIAVGNDADLALVDLSTPSTLHRDSMAHRHRLSPYEGDTFRATIRRTIRRGETIFEGGLFPLTTRGKFIRPQR